MAFKQLSEDTKIFTYALQTVPKVDARTVSPREFYKDYVSKNRPCILQNLVGNWPALSKWDSDDYLVKTSGDAQITVNVTPNGYADALTRIKGSIRKGNSERKVFVKPLEEKMSMSQFLDRLKSSKHTDDATGSQPSVLYCSRQNNSLLDEFPSFIKDIEKHFTYATRSLLNQNLSSTPNSDKVDTRAVEAINLWIGDDRSVSSTHQDPYENFYVVARGKKIFTMYPPSDIGFLYERIYPSAKYVRLPNEQIGIELDGDVISWITMDKTQNEKEIDETFPKFRLAHEVTATVEKGECLYLPALWFHHVQQQGITIAVNYWYDMTFDHKFSFYNFVRTTSGLLPYGESGINGMKHTVVFDFDWTMVNENTDTWVFKQLAPSLYIELMEMRKDGKMGWQELMNFGLRKLKTVYNCGRKELVKALLSIPLFDEIFKIIPLLHGEGHEVIILSDANRFYIETIVKEQGILDSISCIITNGVEWRTGSDKDEKVNGVCEVDVLQIEPYHRVGDHSCNLCPSNLCKGLVLQKLRNENFRRYKKMVYVGDGGGDFCPFTKMHPTDIFYAREDYKCHKNIQKWKENCVAWPNPSSKYWKDGSQVYDFLLDDLEIKTSIKFPSERMLCVDTKTNSGGNCEVMIQLWYRTWGNKKHGIPVLFVHGGPGNCVADYQDINAKFFYLNKFYVIEVDQRGTGRSKPSVRDDWSNMQYYLDISIKQMSEDFEKLRKHLKIDHWLVLEVHGVQH